MRNLSPELMIHDSAGGLLSFDLSQPGIDEIGQACRALRESELAPGACLIRVWVGNDVYRLRLLTRLPFSIGITHTDGGAHEITIPEEVLRHTLKVLDDTSHLRPAPSSSRTSLITYML